MMGAGTFRQHSGKRQCSGCFALAQEPSFADGYIRHEGNTLHVTIWLTGGGRVDVWGWASAGGLYKRNLDLFPLLFRVS
jgi:hypothetical protein